MQTIEATLILILGSAVGYGVRTFLGRYLEKKGENLATKEDIGIITDSIEKVKLDYAHALEETKAGLAALLKVHGFRYEKEYAVLSNLSSLLVDLRDATINLRPVADFRDPKKDDEQIKRERVQFQHETARLVYLESEKNRPFYPSEIYSAIREVIKTSRSESIDYRYKNPWDQGQFSNYWETAEKNQQSVIDGVEGTMQLIRDRVSKWDALV